MSMDRVKQKKKWPARRIATYGIGGVLLLAIVYALFFADNRSRLNVDRDKLIIQEVANGDFQEFIPVNGTLQPIDTRFLDAVEGGTIEAVVQQSGAMVKEGDVLLQLSNTDLQLEVLSRQTSLYDQISNVQRNRLLLEQNDLQVKGQLEEIDYQLELGKPQYERFKRLLVQEVISQREYEEVAKQYEYNLRRRALVYQQYKRDSLARELQLQQYAVSEARMERSLDKVNELLENLTITAPISGQFISPDLEIGQNINPGERLGQIDVLDAFKARVQIDELHQPRIDVGQIGTFTYGGEQYTMKITRVYPTITDGRFEVDMEFVGDAPEEVRRGQTLRIRLELGNPGQALLLPVGGFYQSTGGNWVFVLDGDGRAVQRNIRLGRKNPDFYEVLEGLQPGDRVITSSYDTFGENEVLVFD